MSSIAGSFVLIVAFLSTRNVRAVEVDPDEGIEAPGSFSPTLLVGNMAAYQELMDLCSADTSCAQNYGLTQVQDLDKFTHLLEIADPFPGDPNYLENAMVYTIYGNHTPREIGNYIKLLEMRVAILNRSDVCTGDEYASPINGTIQCTPYAGRSPSDREVQDVIINLLIVVGFFLIFVQVVKFGYQLNRGSWDASLRALAEIETMSQDDLTSSKAVSSSIPPSHYLSPPPSSSLPPSTLVSRARRGQTGWK